MTQTHRAAALIATMIVVLGDQISKWIIAGPLALQERAVIVVLPIFDLKWVENYGVSMGFLTADSDKGRWMLVAITAAIAIGVFIWLWREKQRIDAISLGMILGGAIGNISDRIRFGHVVDFLDLHFGEWHPFLVFNIADAAITIGVLLLVLRALMAREKRDPSENLNA